MLEEVKKRLAEFEKAMRNNRPSVAQVVALMSDMRWAIETIEKAQKPKREKP